jgi:hypothetical protein
MPDLTFSIDGVEAIEFAVTPTLLFKLRISADAGVEVRSVSLNAQLRISANQRPCTLLEQERLAAVFGPPEHWPTTLGSLLWTHVTIVVPPFVGSTTVDLLVPTTCDFEVVSTKYFLLLEDGSVPLELLFSGSVFYLSASGLQVERIGWDKEARCTMPLAVWRQALDNVFPNSAWLRIPRDLFTRLADARTRGAYPSWEATFEELLRVRREPVSP